MYCLLLTTLLLRSKEGVREMYCLLLTKEGVREMPFPLHECVERALALPAARRVGFARELDELLSRFEEEEEPAGLAEAESA